MSASWQASSAERHGDSKVRKLTAGDAKWSEERASASLTRLRAAAGGYSPGFAIPPRPCLRRLERAGKQLGVDAGSTRDWRSAHMTRSSAPRSASERALGQAAVGSPTRTPSPR